MDNWIDVVAAVVGTYLFLSTALFIWAVKARPYWLYHMSHKWHPSAGMTKWEERISWAICYPAGAGLMLMLGLGAFELLWWMPEFVVTSGDTRGMAASAFGFLGGLSVFSHLMEMGEPHSQFNAG